MSAPINLHLGVVPGTPTIGEQTVSAASSITIDPAAGTTIRIALGSTAIATVNINNGSVGQIIVTEIIQDGTGGRSISGWSSSWRLKNGAYVPTPTANVRDVIAWAWDNTSSVWVEIARSMNALVSTAPTGEEVELSLASFCTAAGASPTAGSGNFATSQRFYWTKAAICYGVRFYWAPTSNRSVRCKLWDNSGAAVASVTITTPNSSGIYYAYFSSPVAVSPFVPYAVSMYDTSGTDYSYINRSRFETSSPQLWPPATGGASIYPVRVAPHLVISSYALFNASNDTSIPNTAATAERYTAEPISIAA